jgi:tyrosyl-tRNA synthetase
LSTPAQVDLSRLARTIDEIYSLDELRAKFALKRPLRIKYGVDLTAPFLHIGHAVNLWMMRELQDAGHKVIFLIGDFTTQIGDPTGKSQTRRMISLEESEPNAQEFLNQVGKILHSDPDVFEVRRNSEWFGKMHVGELISLLSTVTHSRLIQRDMFQKRIDNEQEIYMHELLYPILQGYDSAMLKSDLTIVGTDQLFNELMGRFYQEKLGQSPQVVVTTKITPGTDGVEKQSKSLGNYIALSDTPRDKFGKIMSLPDFLITSYLEVYTRMPLDEIREIERGIAGGNFNPMDAKKRLATALVERYHGQEAADAELTWFTETFSLRKTPEAIPIVHVSPNPKVMEMLQACLPNMSKSEIRRLLQQGGVRLNDVRLTQPEEQLHVKDGDTLKVGKRQWFKLSV